MVKNKKDEAVKMKELEVIAKPYIDAGLGKSFAYALAKKPEQEYKNRKAVKILTLILQF